MWNSTGYSSYNLPPRKSSLLPILILNQLLRYAAEKTSRQKKKQKIVNQRIN
jgi:hypothetical protein